MIYFQHDNGMEIRSDKWQCVVAAFISILMLYFGLWFTLCVIFPDHFHSADNFESYTVNKRRLYLFYSFIPSLIGLYVYRRTVKHCLYYNSKGVGQSDGFRNVFVKWETVVSYTNEDFGNYNDKLHEFVLRDKNAHVVFKPFTPMVCTTNSIRNERNQFWMKVIDVIESRGSLQ